MVTPLVDYLVVRDGPPPRRGLAYDYVLGGDGLYLATENPYLRVRVPVARCTVRGLPPLGAACSLPRGRLPQALWEASVRTACAWATEGREVLLVVLAHAGGYRLILPRQWVTSTGVRYWTASGVPLLTLHSHHRLPAYFSPTDDADEQGLGLYAVVGRLDQPCPEVALRVGAYSYWFPLPWEQVFAGQRGAFRDTQFDPPSHGEARQDTR